MHEAKKAGIKVLCNTNFQRNTVAKRNCGVTSKCKMRQAIFVKYCDGISAKMCLRFQQRMNVAHIMHPFNRYYSNGTVRGR